VTRLVQILTDLHDHTPMFAATKEGLLAYVTGLCEGAGVELDPIQFYKRHLKVAGPNLPVHIEELREPADLGWGKRVVADALEQARASIR
jgi:hypothetical protein